MKGFPMIFRNACETYVACVRVIGYAMVAAAIIAFIWGVNAGI